jgi:aminoglycoside phosphotransferase (APT) family kinase protein
VESTTKRRLDRQQISLLLAPVLDDATHLGACDELTEGMFNAVYDVRLEPSGQRMILKASPPAGVPLLTYERNIMRTEASFYELTSTAEGVPTPRVVFTDFSRSSLDGDLLVTSYLPGTGWHRLHENLDRGDTARLRYDLGRIVARTHQITGNHFGYFQDGTAQAPTWRDAFFTMLDNLFVDAERFGVDLPVKAVTIAEELERCAHLLDAVTVPSLAHFDLWEGNILLADCDGRYEISGLIDGERAMWADPVADFASVAIFGDIAGDSDFLDGYGSFTGQQYVVTPEIAVRIAMYKLYLDLIIVIEAAPRGYDAASHAKVLNLAIDDLHRSLGTVRHYS